MAFTYECRCDGLTVELDVCDEESKILLVHILEYQQIKALNAKEKVEPIDGKESKSDN